MLPSQANTRETRSSTPPPAAAVPNLGWRNLHCQLRFEPGSDLPGAYSRQRLAALAAFLKQNPDLALRLDAYADPRGSDEYNNVLAQYRAKHVAQLLQSFGIASERIDSHSHGARYAIAGEPLNYAHERRVEIEVFQPR